VKEIEMSVVKNLAKVAALTCLFSGAGVVALVTAQDEAPPPPPPPPGYEHTGESWHTGDKRYLVIVYPDGTEKHTGITQYLWAYKLKKKEVPVQT
jgi:hypothetical protein